jgi:hypothetical protein
MNRVMKVQIRHLAAWNLSWQSKFVKGVAAAALRSGQASMRLFRYLWCVVFDLTCLKWAWKGALGRARRPANLSNFLSP